VRLKGGPSITRPHQPRSSWDSSRCSSTHLGSAATRRRPLFFKLTKMVPDELIPGTLNVGSSAPVAVEAFAFIAAIAVDLVTLALLVPVGAARGWLGAKLVSQLPRRRI
jgi:hypothetical protein